MENLTHKCCLCVLMLELHDYYEKGGCKELGTVGIGYAKFVDEAHELVKIT